MLPAGFPCERGLNDNGAHQGPSTTQSHGSARNTGTHSMLLHLHIGMLHRMHTRYINIDLIVCLIYCISTGSDANVNNWTVQQQRAQKLIIKCVAEG